MGFRSVPKSVTLSDLEQPLAIISRYFTQYTNTWAVSYELRIISTALEVIKLI